MRERWAWVYWFSRWIEWISIGLIIFFSLLDVLVISKTDWPKIAQLQAWSAKLGSRHILPLAAIAEACSIVAQRIGNPRYRRMLHNIISDFQKKTFSDLNGNHTCEDHRVTLYRHQLVCFWPGIRQNGFLLWPWGWGNYPWSGWLVPIVRAGPHKRPRTVFLAKGGGHGEYEGVAGATYYFQKGMVDIDELPSVADADATIRKDYAKKAYVSFEWLMKRIDKQQPCARCFRAIRIEVDGKNWGVLMIDSLETKLPAPQKTQQQFCTLATVFNIILGKA